MDNSEYSGYEDALHRNYYDARVKRFCEFIIKLLLLNNIEIFYYYIFYFLYF